MEFRKRPKLVWAIFVFYALSLLYKGVVYYAIFAGAVPLNEAQQAYFDSFTSLDHIASLILALASLVAVIFLFQMRKLAFPFMVGTFAAGLLVTLWHWSTKSWLPALVSGGILAAVVGWAIQIAICVYCWNLVRRGVLK
jgi:hypothetical protein